MTGRPTKLTPERKGVILRARRLGLPIDKACLIADVSETTFYNWKNQGEKGKEPYARFLEDIKKANAEGEQYHLENIERAGKETWQASAWWLERNDPAHYSRPIRVKIDDIDNAIHAELAKLATRGQAGNAVPAADVEPETGTGYLGSV